ncbi:MAG: CHAT domain-containing protein, partial [Blastocatellia bacterium]
AYRDARVLARETRDRALEAEIIASAGWVHQSSGDPRQALALYLEALPLMIESRNYVAEVRTRVGIGLLYHSLGEWNKALNQYQAALNIANARAEITDEQLSGILTSATEVYLSAGHPDKARDLFADALALARKGKNKAGEIAVLASMAREAALAGDLHTALTRYENTLELMRAEGNRVGTAGALAGIGEIYFKAAFRGYKKHEDKARKVSLAREPGLTPTFSDNFPVALQYYGEALSIMSATGNLAGEAGILTSIGLLYEYWRKPDKALDHYLRAINALENIRTAARLEEFKTSLAQQAALVYERAILLSLDRGHDIEAFNLSERARARTFLDQLGNARPDLRRGGDTALIAREQTLRLRLDAIEKQLGQERARTAAEVNPEILQSLEERQTSLRKSYEDLLTQVKLTQPEYAALVSVNTLTLPRVQQMLGPDVTLISYLLTTDRSLAFVISRDEFHVTRLPVDSRLLHGPIATFRDFSDLEKPDSPELRQLHKWLIAPLKSRIKTRLVGIVPHGILHKLPFAALSDGKQTLGDTHTLFQLPSLSALPWLRQKQRQDEGPQMLAMANGASAGMPLLRHAGEEARTVAGLFHAEARVGQAATRATLLAQASLHRLLHLVAHYQADTRNPLFSRLLLAPGPDGEGALTLSEVFGMDLQRADLVVLSACQTQLGTQSRGDEIAGLNRAFIYAGAPTVIASLWSVDDQATSQLMREFYQNLNQGLSKAAALRAAQAAVRVSYPHPYYWAGFVLTGHPGEKIGSRESE